jgi:hypothetical protein
MISDYIDLAKRLKKLAEKYGASKEEIKHMLGEMQPVKAQRELQEYMRIF